MLDTWLLLSVLTKFALYLGILGSAGVAFCAIIFTLEKWKMPAFRFAMIGLVAAMLSFLLKGAALTGDATGMTDPEMLALLWNTQNGTALLFQLVGLGLLMCGLVIAPGGQTFCGMGGLIALYSFLVIGHIDDRDNGWLTGILFLHLVTASLWIGVLIPLKSLAKNSDHFEDAIQLGKRFGLFASFAVPILLMAGSIMMWQLVGSWGGIINTEYGLSLLIKISLVILLLALAAINKLRFVPAMERGDITAGRNLSRSINFELVAVCLILLITAVLTSVFVLPT